MPKMLMSVLSSDQRQQLVTMHQSRDHSPSPEVPNCIIIAGDVNYPASPLESDESSTNSETIQLVLDNSDPTRNIEVQAPIVEPEEQQPPPLDD